jgi:hypothetical protein
MSSPAIRRATAKSSASQPRFGLVMHPRRVFPLFATDPCFAALGRCAPVSLILPGLAELYFQSNDRLPVKTMSILNSWPSSSVCCFWQEQNIIKEINYQQSKKLLHVGITTPIRLPYSNKPNNPPRDRRGINASAPTEKLPASRLQFRPAPGGNAGDWHTQSRVPLIRG